MKRQLLKRGLCITLCAALVVCLLPLTHVTALEPHGVNVVLNCPATVSNIENVGTANAKGTVLPYTAARALDGSTADHSYWYTTATDKTLTVTLANTYYIDRYVVKGIRKNNDVTLYPSSFKLHTSTDGTNWTMVSQVFGNTQAERTITFEPVLARYVRLEVVQGNRNNNQWTAISEFEVYSAASLQVGYQQGTLYDSTPSTATFPVVFSGTADGEKACTVSWYSDGAGQNPITAPAGVTLSMSAVSENAATITAQTTAQAVPGLFYFKLTTSEVLAANIVPLEVTKINFAPKRKEGVPATLTHSIVVGTEFLLDLTDIFEDANGDVMSYKVKVDSAEAVAASANYSYTPATIGTTTLIFWAHDGTVSSAESYMVTLTATDPPINTPPARKAGIGATATASVTAGQAYALYLYNIFEDIDSDELTYTVAVNGAEAVAADESYSYTPADAGTTTLVFWAHDGTATSAESYTVTLTATEPPANTPPARKAEVSATATASVMVGEPYSLNLSDIFEDADGDTLTYTVAVNGAEAVAADESYLYTPADAGTTDLVFWASDGMATSADSFALTLTATEPGVNTPPSARVPVPTQAVAVNETKSFTASAVAQDAEEDPLTITAIAVSPDATVATAALASGTVTVTGVAQGSTGVTVTVSDGELTADIVVPITVAEQPHEMYTLTVTAGSGGQITAGGGSFRAGEQIPVAAQAHAGYRFDGWTSTGGGSFANARSATTTFTMPANNATVRAAFTAVSGGGSEGSTHSERDIITSTDVNWTTGRITTTLFHTTWVRSDVFLDLLNNHAGQDIVFIGSGYSIQFAAGSINPSGLRPNYNFGVQFNSGESFASIQALSRGNLALMIGYAHSGALPSPAKIRLNVGTQYTGKTLYYYYYNPVSNRLEFMQTAKVDAQGYVMVTQSRCSDYALLSEPLPMDKPGIPETGASLPVAQFFLLLLVAAVGGTLLRKTAIANR